MHQHSPRGLVRAIVDNPYMMTNEEAEQRIAVALKRIATNDVLHRSSVEYRKSMGRIGSSTRRRYVVRILSEAQNHRCCNCGVVMNFEHYREGDNPNAATIEHIIPASWGGPFHFYNLVASCYQCNLDRGVETDLTVLLPMFPTIEWRDVVVPISNHLPPISFSGASTHLPSVVRDNASIDWIMAEVPIIYEENARKEMPFAIEQLLSMQQLSRDDPRYLRLFGSMKSKRLKREMIVRLSEAQNHRCPFCGNDMDPFVVNHDGAVSSLSPVIVSIIPKEFGGPTHEINYAVAHYRCQSKMFREHVRMMREFYLNERGELSNRQRRRALYWKPRENSLENVE
jgi:5-methylcytosine-specific restriction endonuclease McrA